MKIAIDCRYLGRSGIGRVCEGILRSLDYSAHSYYLIGKREKLREFTNATLIEDDSDPYSVKGLLRFPAKTVNRECDCLLVPNFLIPYFVKKPVYAIMHDLAFLDVKETTRGWSDRLIKKRLLKRCMKKAKAISCVSGFTLKRCEFYYGKLAEKCFVNYNGVSENVTEYAKTHRPEKTDQIVYVGNVKPHKGLKTLIRSFLVANSGDVLKIIGEKENFLTGLSLDETAFKNVIFTGKIDDEELFSEIGKSKYLVLPSQYEGFGLPPLEALCLGTQPIVSDIEVFREVYEGLPVIYFSDETDLTEKLRRPPQAVDCAEEVARRYRYEDCAKTLIGRIEKELL
ncbi:MAG: glycosyltransferase family 4 protein [Candidatus Gallimonas sp.]